MKMITTSYNQNCNLCSENNIPRQDDQSTQSSMDCSFIYLTKFRYRKLTCNQSLYYTTTRHTCHKNHLIVPVVKFREKLVERNDHPCAALPIGGCCTILVTTRPLLFVKTRLKESSLTLSTSCLRGPPSHQGGSP